MSSAPLLPAAWNRGHAYRDRVMTAVDSISAFYAQRYGHSERAIWDQRLVAGEIWCNGRQLRGDAALAPGDRLVWHRPPWQEPAVPVLAEHAVVFDDGDLLVLNKPSGLPVLPAGGFLEHTLLAQLRAWPRGGTARPVHRLGRFTSGLLVCARRPASRAWLSAQLRESTRRGLEASPVGPGAAAGPGAKRYRALTQPLPADWAVGETRPLHTAIGRRPHPLLGTIWCAAEAASGALASHSALRLLERRRGASLVEVRIHTGRPHQIRIHAAALGAPLIGDPLYGPGGLARPEALPGDGGYHLHAHRITLQPPQGGLLELEAPLPPELRSGLLEGQQA